MKWPHHMMPTVPPVTSLSDEAKRWNTFIQQVCSRHLGALSPIQRNAVLTFWYDAEMRSGGHSGYFDCYPEIRADDLIAALQAVGASAFVANYQEALTVGEEDEYDWTDTAFYAIRPTLTELLEQYVEQHREEILGVRV